MADPDVWFDPAETLVRDVEKLKKGGGVRAGELRLQVSVHRLGHPSYTAPAPPKIAAKISVSAAELTQCQSSSARFRCVVEPTKERDDHALIAIVADPSERSSITEEQRLGFATDLRAKLAEQFR